MAETFSGPAARATYRCSECGDLREGQPAVRMPFDERLRQMSEETEGAIIDILASYGARMESPNGLYELCPGCRDELELGEEVEELDI